MKLTVIIRDDSPMIFCGDSPTFRSVQIDLTQEQEKAIELKITGTDGGKEIKESYSRCFLERKE